MQSWINSLSLANPSIDDLWRFLPFGYLLTVLIESPLLLLFLPKLSLRQKLWNGVWLTACTYPIVVLVLPAWMMLFSRGTYLLIAETFAPLTECWVFWLAKPSMQPYERRDWVVSFAAIILANLASFVVGEILWSNGVRFF